MSKSQKSRRQLDDDLKCSIFYNWQKSPEKVMDLVNCSSLRYVMHPLAGVESEESEGKLEE